jgi:hypothetical protein
MQLSMYININPVSRAEIASVQMNLNTGSEQQGRLIEDEMTWSWDEKLWKDSNALFRQMASLRVGPR